MAEAKEVTAVHNLNIAGIDRRLKRMLKEMSHSQSASATDTMGFDIVRIEAMLGALGGYIDHVVNDPQLDQPESHPYTFKLDEMPTLPGVENDALVDLINSMLILQIEAVHSQSARKASGYTEHDVKRFRDHLAKAQNFVEAYIKVIQPIDNPESSPKEPMTPAGSLGLG